MITSSLSLKVYRTLESQIFGLVLQVCPLSYLKIGIEDVNVDDWQCSLYL